MTAAAELQRKAAEAAKRASELACDEARLDSEMSDLTTRAAAAAAAETAALAKKELTAEAARRAAAEAAAVEAAGRGAADGQTLEEEAAKLVATPNHLLDHLKARRSLSDWEPESSTDVKRCIELNEAVVKMAEEKGDNGKHSTPIA